MNSIFDSQDYKSEVLINNAFNILSKDFLTLLSSISKLNEEIRSNDSRLEQATSNLEGEILDYDFFQQDTANEQKAFQSYLSANFNLHVLRTLDSNKFSSKVIVNLKDSFRKIFEFNKSFYGNSLNQSNILAVSSHKETFDFIINNFSSIEAPSNMITTLVEMMKNQEELRFVYSKIDKSLVVIFELLLFILKNTVRKRIGNRLYGDSLKKHKNIIEMKDNIEKDSELLKESYKSMAFFKNELRQLLECKTSLKSEVSNKHESHNDELPKKLVERFSISKKYTVNFIKKNAVGQDQCGLYAVVKLKSKFRECRKFLGTVVSNSSNSFKDDCTPPENKLDNFSYLEKGLDACTLLLKIEEANFMIKEQQAEKKENLNKQFMEFVIDNNELFSYPLKNSVYQTPSILVTDATHSTTIHKTGALKKKLSFLKTFMTTYESSSMNVVGI